LHIKVLVARFCANHRPGISTTGKDAVMAGWKDLFETIKQFPTSVPQQASSLAINNIMAWETGIRMRRILTARAATIRLLA